MKKVVMIINTGQDIAVLIKNNVCSTHGLIMLSGKFEQILVLHVSSYASVIG